MSTALQSTVALPDQVANAEQTCESKAKTVHISTFEVKKNGECKCFEGFDGEAQLADAIRNGELGAGTRARQLLPDQATPSWQPLENVVRSTYALDVLFRPIRAHAMRGIGWGIGVCCALKLLETTGSLLYYAPDFGVRWVIYLALMVGSGRFPILLPVLIIGSIKFGVGMTFFGMLFGIAATGIAFGLPAGLAVGTIVGLVRSKRIKTAPKRKAETGKAWLYGVLAPTAAIATLVWFYLTKFMPMAIEMLEESA